MVLDHNSIINQKIQKNSLKSENCRYQHKMNKSELGLPKVPSQQISKQSGKQKLKLQIFTKNDKNIC